MKLRQQIYREARKYLSKEDARYFAIKLVELALKD